jgi:hypothetical protein
LFGGKGEMIATYIADPISGNVDISKQVFFNAVEQLQSSDRVVLHSASLPAGLTEPQYMDICYAMRFLCCLNGVVEMALQQNIIMRRRLVC